MASVVAVPVKEGDLVAKGQLLVEIDPQTAKGQESQARGALAQAKAGLALAERNYQRFEALQKSGSASDLELDMARMQYEQAKGAVEQAIGRRRGGLLRRAGVARRRPVRRARREEDGRAGRPRRPRPAARDGRVDGRPPARPAPFPRASSPPRSSRSGATLPVTLDATPGAAPIKGRVVEMSPGADPASHSFTAKVEVGGALVPTRRLRPRRPRDGPPDGRRRPRLGRPPAGRDEPRRREGRAGEGADPRRHARRPDGDVVEVLSGLKGGEELLVGLPAAPADGAEVRGPATGEVTK